MSDARFAEMISKIAHELRSPLTSVKGFSATLISRWDRFTDEQRLQLVETIHADAERMARIVSEVLDLARIESGRLELRKREVSLSKLVGEAVEHVAQLPGADRIEPSVPDELSVAVDPERLMHVLSNVIENAVKFSDEGPIGITAAREDGKVIVRVSDQGVGIPSDLIGGIFSGPGPRSGKASPLGTGLGLYLSRRVMELHEGDITVVSTEGEGSVFSIVLPVNAADG